MPDLFIFDDYEQCMSLEEDRSTAAYCVVNAFIKPDDSSILYNYIDEFSKREKQHFRHDKVQRGICVQKCLRLINDLGDSSETFHIEQFAMDSKLTFDFVEYAFVKEDREKLNRILNICINKQLSDNYNLSAFSSIEYCLRHDQNISKGLFKLYNC